jgi:hypothetical protein
VWAPLRGVKEAEEEPRGPPTPLLLNNVGDGDWCNGRTLWISMSEHAVAELSSDVSACPMVCSSPSYGRAPGLLGLTGGGGGGVARMRNGMTQRHQSKNV